MVLDGKNAVIYGAAGAIGSAVATTFALEDFMRPIETAVRSTFITTRAAARQMIPKRDGAILIFGGSGDPVPDYNIGGFQVGLHALIDP
jgi:NAD(P)-dependent dehydrogenase (short-subunit alcohol dehydrogenase family)